MVSGPLSQHHTYQVNVLNLISEGNDFLSPPTPEQSWMFFKDRAFTCDSFGVLSHFIVTIFSEVNIASVYFSELFLMDLLLRYIGLHMKKIELLTLFPSIKP